MGNTECSPSVWRPSPVHPHERGEYEIPPVQEEGRGGSSPRTWGILSHRRIKGLGKRFIPTNVGNTRPAVWVIFERAVHPHERGEYAMTWSIAVSMARFIPTNVGNTIPSSCNSWTGTVHPHERGEYHTRRRSADAGGGSSPRTWGIHIHVEIAGREDRFIPTNVGNTMKGRSPSRPISVHPHERGEYQRRRPIMSYLDGSSPRTWGILAIFWIDWARVRFIPTNVGNTTSIGG